MGPLKNTKHEAFASWLKTAPVDVAADHAGLKIEPARLDHPGCYVYILADPADGRAFYIGKGVRVRWRQHFACRGPNVAKKTKILAILATGHQPLAYVVQDGLSDREAFRLEDFLIRSVGYSNLTNKPFTGGANTLLGQVTDMWRRLKTVNQWARDRPGYTERDLKIYWFVYDGVCHLKSILEAKERAKANA